MDLRTLGTTGPQVSAIGLFGVVPEHEKKLLYLSGVDRCKFRRPVLPGDQLRCELEMIQNRGRTCRMKGVAYVDGNVVAVEWWTRMRSEGQEVTLVGCLLLRMAPDGRCKAFDQRADGFVRSEGAGIVVDSVPEHEDLECRNKAAAILTLVFDALKGYLPVLAVLICAMAVPRSASCSK